MHIKWEKHTHTKNQYHSQREKHSDRVTERERNKIRKIYSQRGTLREEKHTERYTCWETHIQRDKPRDTQTQQTDRDIHTERHPHPGRETLLTARHPKH